MKRCVLTQASLMNFSPILVKAGESAGVLDTILDEIASYKERIESIKGKIKKALYYPIAVIGVAIVVSAILLIYVIPQFEDIFASFGAALPAFTQAIIDASRWLRSNGLYALFGVVVLIAAFVLAKTAIQAIRTFHRPDFFKNPHYW